MNSTSKTPMFWFLSFCLLTLLAFSLYQVIDGSGVRLTRIAVVFALSPMVFREIPRLRNRKHLNTFLITHALMLVGLQIYRDLTR